jgi:pimeloyl-ACP methyl ester carboxylesterase
MLQVQTQIRAPAYPRARVATTRALPEHPARLAYVERGAGGAGQSVVVLHGLASAGRSLAAAALPLADLGMHIYLPDLLGHGASPYTANDRYDIESHLGALRRWQREAAVAGPVWLVGYSIGALLAMAWAAREPEWVRGIVAIGAPLYRDALEARQSLTKRDLFVRLMLQTPWLAKPLTRLMCGPEGLGVRLSGVHFLRRAYTWALVHGYGPKPAPGGEALASPTDVEAGLLCGLEVCWLHCWESVSRSLEHCIIQHRAWPDLERLRDLDVPLLFIHGDQDALAPVQHVRSAARLCRWPVIEYAGASHSLAMTHAPALNRALADHFTAVGAI